LLQRFICKMICLKEGSVLGNGVEKIHGVLFSWLKNLDSELSTIIHNSDIRAFTVSPICFNNSQLRKNGRLYFQKDSVYYFYVHSLDFFTFEAFTKLSEVENEKVFFIGDVFFKCVEFKPLEESVSYKQIVDYSIFWKNSIEKVSFYFLSPTSFRRQGQQLLFPLPELIFGNLLNRWNQLSSFPFEKIDVEEFGRIMISQYNLSTEMIKFSNYKVIGFKGKVFSEFII